MSLLEVTNLHTEFPTPNGTVKAVNGVDLSVEKGEVVGIVGESGSGKSVLAKSILQILEEPGKVTEGTISFKGEDMLEKSEKELRGIRGGSIAMIFQDPMNSLNPVIPIGEQIAESVRLHQDVGESVHISAEMKRKILGTVKNSTAWLKAIDYLETVAIPEPDSRATNYPHQFSGGMRQRAMIAIALAGEPDLLIADEPTTALDVTIQAQILDEITELLELFDMSIIFITHDLPVVAETCDKVNVMYAGEIVERADVDELFKEPQHPYTQALLKSIPDMDGKSEKVEPIPGTVPNLIDIPQACHFAPRCPEATERCYDEEPEMRQTGAENHISACHFRGEEVDE